LASFKEHFDNLRKDILEAQDSGTLGNQKSLELEGLSGESLVGCLQRFTRFLSRDPNTCYLEIGVFRGLTLVSTSMVNPDVTCYGIDNFSLFDEGHENLEIVTKNIERLNISNAHMLNLDFEEALDDLDALTNGKHVGVLFVDGPHDYRSQIITLLKAKRHLSDKAVIVVDDSNYAHVRQANADFLESNDEFALIFEAYTQSHPANMDDSAKASSLKKWWNGVNILVHDPEHLIERSLPSVNSKDRFFLSHDVFRHEFVESAIEALRYASGLIDGDESGELQARSKLKETLEEHREKFPNRFPFQNTSSSGLTEFKLHV
jgi:hypothetical protein